MIPEESFGETGEIRKQQLITEVEASTDEAIAERILQLEEEIRHLKKISTMDSLTELLNRNGLDQNWQRIFDHLNRHPNEDPGVMVLIDLNDFKKANDKYGHEIGDQVLVEFAAVLREFTRKEDTRGRKGGDEFEVHFDGASIQDAELILERINQELMNRTKHLFNGIPVVTISRGIVRIVIDKTQNIDTMIEQNRRMADQAMYVHKDSIKNGLLSVEEADMSQNLGLKS